MANKKGTWVWECPPRPRSPLQFKKVKLPTKCGKVKTPDPDVHTHINAMSPIPTQSDSISSEEKHTDNITLKLLSLNVAGLASKLNKGILDQFLFEQDIICLCETNTDSPDLSNTLLNEYICFAKNKIDSVKKYKYTWPMYVRCELPCLISFIDPFEWK